MLNFKRKDMKKFLFLLMAGLLLCNTNVLGQVSKKEAKAALKAAIKNGPLSADAILRPEKPVDLFVDAPSIPTSNFFTVQDSTGKIVKRPFDELPADTRARMYYFGRGVERNLDKAIECFESMIAESKNSYTDVEKHYLQYIKCLKESQYLGVDTKMCTYFSENLGETNDYFERVIQNDAPVAIKRERALLWVTAFFRPEEYTIESSDNSTKLIIKFRYNDNFWIPLVVNPGTSKATESDSGDWYSFSGQLMLDFKDTRYRVRLMYPNYSKRFLTLLDRSLENKTSANERQNGVVDLMNQSRNNISSCLRYEHGIELVDVGSKKVKENVYRKDAQSVYDNANAFLKIMAKYNSIFSSLEEALKKAVDDRNVKADDF